jgi:transcriptional regulator with XRE-family HTH domain
MENIEFRRLLHLSGWTQAQAAEELHVDRVTVNRYVNDAVRPSLTVLRLFAELAGDRVRLPNITVGSERLAETEPRRLARWEEKALLVLGSLTPPRRDKLIEFAAAMAPTSQEAKEVINPPRKDPFAPLTEEEKAEILAKELTPERLARIRGEAPKRSSFAPRKSPES